MFRRILIINLLLVTAVTAGTLKLRRDAIAFRSTHRAGQIQPQSEKVTSNAKPITGTAPVPSDWTEIAARNPFSFDRNDIAVVASAPAAQQPKRPKPLLFGTMLLGNDRLAMLSPGDSGSRASRPVRVGETFDGWTVAEIQSKTVIVKWDDIKQTLVMDDPTAQLARDYSKTGTAGNTAAAVITVAPAAPPPPSVNQAPTNSTPPVINPATGRRQILIHTPFGDKTIDEPLP